MRDQFDTKNLVKKSGGSSDMAVNMAMLQSAEKHAKLEKTKAENEGFEGEGDCDR